MRDRKNPHKGVMNEYVYYPIYQLAFDNTEAEIDDIVYKDTFNHFEDYEHLDIEEIIELISSYHDDIVHHKLYLIYTGRDLAESGHYWFDEVRNDFLRQLKSRGLSKEIISHATYEVPKIAERIGSQIWHWTYSVFVKKYLKG